MDLHAESLAEETLELKQLVDIGEALKSLSILELVERHNIMGASIVRLVGTRESVEGLAGAIETLSQASAEEHIEHPWPALLGKSNFSEEPLKPDEQNRRTMFLAMINAGRFTPCTAEAFGKLGFIAYSAGWQEGGVRQERLAENVVSVLMQLVQEQVAVLLVKKGLLPKAALSSKAIREEKIDPDRSVKIDITRGMKATSLLVGKALKIL